MSERVALMNNTYTDGLNDVWNFIKTLRKMPNLEAKEVFGYDYLYGIVDNLTPQEALSKLDSYEKSKSINVGDIVIVKNDSPSDGKGVVTRKFGNEVTVMWHDGSAGEWRIDELTKTNEHIEINAIIKQLMEE